jgi:putative transposase
VVKRFEVPDGWIAKGYTFALDPAPEQLPAIARHFGARRFAYNWGLALVKAQMDEAARASEQARCEGLSDREANAPWQRCDHAGWNLPALRLRWNAEKESVAVGRESGEPWWQEVSKEAFSSGLADLGTALGNWNASKQGVRKGPRMGFPRFKKRSEGNGRLRFTTGAMRLEADRRHVVLPRLGRIRTSENTRRLERLVAKGRARILSATLSERGGRINVSFACLVAHSPGTPPPGLVGVDLGVGDNLAVVGTANEVQVGRLKNRRPGRMLAPRIAAAQRHLKRRVPGSSRYRDAARRVARLHMKAVGIRSHHAHVFTHRLAETQGAVVLEDLNVKGMALREGMRLGRSVNDAGMSELKRQILYKVGWAGGQVKVVSRWFASSQTCCTPGCDHRYHELKLSERSWTCPECNITHDRDLCSAANLAQQAELGPGAEPTVRPDLVGLVAMKREGTGDFLGANPGRGAEMAVVMADNPFGNGISLSNLLARCPARGSPPGPPLRAAELGPARVDWRTLRGAPRHRVAPWTVPSSLCDVGAVGLYLPSPTQKASAPQTR